MNYHNKRFPGESNEYREERNKLLEAEINLRRQTEQVAAMRRRLPYGAKIKEDYVFQEKDGSGNIKKTPLSGLFEEGKDSLIIYSYMFGPKNKTPCTSCTSILDGLNGMVFHAKQRVNIAVVAKTSIDILTGWAENRVGKTYDCFLLQGILTIKIILVKMKKVINCRYLMCFIKPGKEFFILMQQNYYSRLQKKVKTEGMSMQYGHCGIYLIIHLKGVVQTGIQNFHMEFSRLP